MSKKEENKKKKNIDFVSVLALFMLIIAVLMIIAGLGFGKGFGFGNGDGSGSGNSDNTSISENQETSGETAENEPAEETTAEIPPESVIYIQVTVSGSTYVTDGNETTLESITEIAKGDNIIVRITDDNAVADAMDNLISALEENNISYVEPTAE